MTNVPASFLTAQMKVYIHRTYRYTSIISICPGGGVLDISLGGEVRPGLSYPDPV